MSLKEVHQIRYSMKLARSHWEQRGYVVFTTNPFRTQLLFDIFNGIAVGGGETILFRICIERAKSVKQLTAFKRKNPFVRVVLMIHKANKGMEQREF